MSTRYNVRVMVLLPYHHHDHCCATVELSDWNVKRGKGDAGEGGKLLEPAQFGICLVD